MFGDYGFDLTIKDPRTGEAVTSGCLVFVYTAGTKTLATIYSNDARTAKTNPISRTQFALDDKISFWAAASTVDLFIADDKGNVTFIPSVAVTDHVILLNRDGVDKCFVAPFAFNASGAEVDTGLDFPLNVKIYDAAVEVVDTDSGETVDIGLLSSETAGDADGILVGASLTSAAFIQLWAVTDSTTEDFIASPKKGALMGVGSAGTSAANDFGSSGGPGHIVSGSNAKSLVYNVSSSDTGTGYIYVFFKHLR